MSSPSSSSSATAGRLRWTRPRRPRRRTLIEWGAAALAAAALYLTPALLLGVLSGIGWAIAAFAAADTCGSFGLRVRARMGRRGRPARRIGGLGAHHRRVLPLLAAVVAAGAWVALVAHVVPGGAGPCFN